MIATSGFLTALECTKFVFGRGSDRTPLGELTAFPRPPSWFKGPTSKGRGGEGKGTGERKKGEVRGRKGRGREGRKVETLPPSIPAYAACELDYLYTYTNCSSLYDCHSIRQE